MKKSVFRHKLLVRISEKVANQMTTLFCKICRSVTRLMIFVISLIAIHCTPAGRDVTIRYLHENWRFRQEGTSEFLPASVPGTVHTDLLKNGRIDDFFFRTNEENQQWIDKLNWEYRTEFIADEDIYSKRHIELVFEGLDTYTDIYLNGVLLAQTGNMFRIWVLDCRNLIVKGRNELKIIFRSPVIVDLPKLDALGYALPASNDQSERGQLGNQKISVFARKAPYHYGWDWGPRFVTMGIWRPVRIRAWENICIDDMHIIQDSLSSTKASLKSVFEVRAAEDMDVQIVVKNEDQILARKPVKLHSGLNTDTIQFIIKNPDLWWPNGLGTPRLYSLTGEIYIDNSLADAKTQQTGIRKVRLVRDADVKGQSFYFEVNDVPVFAKGANYIPSDVFLPRVSKSKYEHIIHSAAEVNMNMLRVWGGGIYENDIFYDLCDKYGLMIWQDFIFSCSMYPGDSLFLQNVRNEVTDNIRRLRNHPSIVLWCGNNEIDEAWSAGTSGGWGWKERFDRPTRMKIWNDYEKIFHQLIPELVNDLDGTRPYWPSSPLAGWGRRASVSGESGDMHYWGVWHGKESFEEFKNHRARFMSEYGFQSFPEFRSVQLYTVPRDWYLNSEVMTAHQRSGIGNERIRMYMKRYYHVPQNFEHLLYVGQVLQAEGIKIGMETHRRNKPYCMGTLYWQLNDCWPVASWSSIDYYGRWKALHYFAAKAYKSVVVLPVLNRDSLLVNVVSDRRQPFEGSLFMNLIDFYGNNFWSDSMQVRIEPNENRLVFGKRVEQITSGRNKNEIVFSTVLKANGEEKTENLLYFKPVRELHLPAVQIKTEIARKDGNFLVTLKSDVLAKNVYLRVQDDDGFFSDNYFDLLPGVPVAVTYHPAGRIENPEERLIILSIRDTYFGE